MKNRFFFLLRWFSASLLVCAQIAIADDTAIRHQAVSDLGRLNGVALHCKYLEQVRIMKAAVVAHAPKQRSYGLAFDEATNQAFLAHIRDGDPCPGPAAFARRVADGVEQLSRVFGGRSDPTAIGQ